MHGYCSERVREGLEEREREGERERDWKSIPTDRPTERYSYCCAHSWELVQRTLQWWLEQIVLVIMVMMKEVVVVLLVAMERLFEKKTPPTGWE